jgi:hypothetical protein
MLKIKIGSNNASKEQNNNSSIKTQMQIRRSLDGKLLINDHEDLDIVIDQDKGKIIAFSTDMKNSDKNYFTQDRFFKHLVKKGIVDAESIKAGNIYGCLEGEILVPKESNINAIDVAILVIDKWIETERPSFMYQKAKEEEFSEDLTDPDDKNSTPLGKVSHRSATKQDQKPGSALLPTQIPY